jgi:hypothetical protein
MSFWDFIWWLLWVYVFFAYLMLLFRILADVIRDRHLAGGWKAVWIILLIFVPFITAIVYLIARGRGMSERAYAEAADIQRQTDSYIQKVAGTSPSDEIDKAAKLLAAGTITPEEFAHIKSRALA